jgi:hypothetical protein
VRKPQKLTIDFAGMMAWLMTQVMYGKAHFGIAAGLYCADKVVLKTAPRFFELTAGAHVNEAVMCAARIFDRDARSLSVHVLFAEVSRIAAARTDGMGKKLNVAVTDGRKSIVGMERILKALRLKRNKSIAHSDTDSMNDPEPYFRDSFVNFGELNTLFEEIASILNRIGSARGLKLREMKLSGTYDFERALGLIADAKCAQAEAYEEKYGRPYNRPVPKKCAQRKLAR